MLLLGGFVIRLGAVYGQLGLLFLFFIIGAGGLEPQLLQIPGGGGDLLFQDLLINGKKGIPRGHCLPGTHKNLGNQQAGFYGEGALP